MKRINSASMKDIFPNLYACNNHLPVRVKRFSNNKNVNTWLSISDFNNKTLILSHNIPKSSNDSPSYRLLTDSFDLIVESLELNIQPEEFAKRFPTFLTFL